MSGCLRFEIYVHCLHHVILFGLCSEFVVDCRYGFGSFIVDVNEQNSNQKIQPLCQKNLSWKKNNVQSRMYVSCDVTTNILTILIFSCFPVNRFVHTKSFLPMDFFLYQLIYYYFENGKFKMVCFVRYLD